MMDWVGSHRGLLSTKALRAPPARRPAVRRVVAANAHTHRPAFRPDAPDQRRHGQKKTTTQGGREGRGGSAPSHGVRRAVDADAAGRSRIHTYIIHCTKYLASYCMIAYSLRVPSFSIATRYHIRYLYAQIWPVLRTLRLISHFPYHHILSTALDARWLP